MQRYFVQLSYKGTNYHGWQAQPNAMTVQEVLENILSTILREKIGLTGAGRTDTGVHASFYVAHFDSKDTNLDRRDFIFRLNSFLPRDIAVQKIWKVPPAAHARFDALSRTYKYVISKTKNPFNEETAYLYTLPLNVAKMNEAAQVLFDFADFKSFSKTHTDVKTFNCKVYEVEWKEEGSQLVFIIRADRFLRNMVRAIVGTLLEAGKGKLTAADLKNIIELRDRRAAGMSVPPHGLFLTAIEYPANLF